MPVATGTTGLNLRRAMGQTGFDRSLQTGDACRVVGSLIITGNILSANLFGLGGGHALVYA